MKIIKYLALMFCLLLFFTGCGPEPGKKAVDTASAYTVTDAQGTKVTIAKKPQRILTYSYTFDGILLGIVPPERMAAVYATSADKTRSWAYKEAGQVPEKINELAGTLPIERVMKLKPDLIIASTWTKPEAVQSLRDLGYPVVVCKGPVTIDEVKDTVTMIAKATHDEPAGAKIIAQMDKELQEIKEVLAKQTGKKPSGLLVSMMQSYGGPGCMYDTLCNTARVENSIATAGLKNGEKLTKELIVKVNPDFFLISQANANDIYNYNDFKDELINDPALRGLKALNNIKELPERSIYSASQNCVTAVKEFVNVAYGPIFDLSKASLIKGY